MHHSYKNSGLSKVESILRRMLTQAVLVALLAITETCAISDHNAVFKSPLHARAECVKYRMAQNTTLIGSPLRTDEESTCVCRCELIKLGLWDSCRGHQPEVPSDQYYDPDEEDRCYRERLRQCLRERLTPGKDQCSKSFVYYKCYNDQYGTVFLDRIGYVPSGQLKHEQIVRDCARILQLSKGDLKTIAQNPLQADKSGKCLFRCFLIREGLYSDHGGFNKERIFAQFAKKNDRELFLRRLQQCYDRLRSECWDRCTLATRLVQDCLDENATALDNILSALSSITVE
uniref:General odorant-binding protein 45 n=1 Tax=Culex pipiens TaxID=7175 RepID=A0A8D8E152_CULPI